MKGEVCLVVSRIKECWDTENKIAFITDGVVDFLDKDWLSQIDYQNIDPPATARNHHLDIYDFIDERMPRYRKELGAILNQIHGVELDQRCWGLALDSWLMHFLAVIYDRTSKLRNAQNQIDNLYIKKINFNKRIFQTSLDFKVQSRKEVFNQFLYAEIATVLEVEVRDCSKEEILKIHNKVSANVMSSSRGIRIAALRYSKKFVGALARAWVKLFDPVLILDGYFSKKDALAIMVYSLGKVVVLPALLFFQKPPAVECNEKMRSALKVSVSDDYDKITNRLLFITFSANMLENYSEVNKRICAYKRIPALGSAIGLCSNDMYKILAGKVVAEGGSIVGFQHGGGYGIQKYRTQEDFEKTSVDKFYGWISRGRKEISLPTINLRSLNDYKRKRSQTNISQLEGVLFVATNTSRYVYSQHPDNADRFLPMLAEQFQFYSKLNSKIKQSFILRAYPNDHGWQYKERWAEHFGNTIKFDSSKDCSESLTKCRVYVTDHISTTWLQAFYLDVPVVLYFDCDRYNMRDEVRELFEKLKGAGLLYDSAENAALFVNMNFESIEIWWNSSDTQSVVEEFKNYFFCLSGEFVQDWTNELLSWHR